MSQEPGITTTARDLRRALEIVEPGVRGKPTMPILSHVFLKDGMAITTDLEVCISYPFAQVEKGAHPPLLPAFRPLMDLATALPSHSKLTLKASKDNQIMVEYDSGYTTIKGPDPSEFPPIPSVDDPEITIDGNAFIQGLDAVAIACATKDSRPVLTGVCISPGQSGSGLDLVAADGFRLYVWALNDELPLAGRQLILPVRSVRALGNAWGRAEKHLPPVIPIENGQPAPIFAPKFPLSVAFSHGKVRFSHGGLTIHSQLIDGTFPNYSQLIPTEGHKITFFAPDLNGAVHRVGAPASDIIKLIWTQERMTVQARDEDSNLSSTTIECLAESPGRWAVSRNFLLDVLRPASAFMSMWWYRENAPVVSQYRKELLAVVMPMLVKWDDSTPDQQHNTDIGADQSEEAVPDLVDDVGDS